MSDVEFVKIISIWCPSVQFGRRSMKSIQQDWRIEYASSQIGAAMLDSQLGRDLWRHARVKREVFREGSAAVIWLV